MKVAVVQDWLVVDGGAEKVLNEILNVYPQADLFSLIDFMPKDVREKVLLGKKAKTSWLQKLPFVKHYYRNLLFLFPKAIESLNLEEYDLIISSSHCVAKGVKRVKGKQLHICYCHSPVRYAWDLREQYLNDMSFVKKVVFKLIINGIAKWDLKTVDNVDHFIANSHNVQERIKRIYNREAFVIYPPADVSVFTFQEKKKDYYFTSCRMVPYKKVSLIVKAFALLPHLKLIVAGDGPELKRLMKKKILNVEYLGFLAQDKLIKKIQNAKAYILAANEDFGITSIEAQSCGTPVIALKKGGYLETVLNNETGVFFDEQTVVSLRNTIKDFENNPLSINQDVLIKHINDFTIDSFKKKIKKYVSEKYSH